MSAKLADDPLGPPSVTSKMSLDDALSELGYGGDDWPSIEDVTKRFRTPSYGVGVQTDFTWCSRYKELQLKYHPDKCTSSSIEESTYKASRLNRAREIITRAHNLSSKQENSCPHANQHSTKDTTTTFPPVNPFVIPENLDPKCASMSYKTSAAWSDRSASVLQGREESMSYSKPEGSMHQKCSKLATRVLTNFFDDESEPLDDKSEIPIAQDIGASAVDRSQKVATCELSHCIDSSFSSTTTKLPGGPCVEQLQTGQMETTNLDKEGVSFLESQRERSSNGSVPPLSSNLVLMTVRNESTAAREPAARETAVMLANHLQPSTNCPKRASSARHTPDKSLQAIDLESTEARKDGSEACETACADEWEHDFDYVTAASARPSWDLLMSNLSVLAKVGIGQIFEDCFMNRTDGPKMLMKRLRARSIQACAWNRTRILVGPESLEQFL